MALNVVLIGPPGAGKGTQAGRLAARLNVPRISTGDLLREAGELGTPLGGLVGAVMARGELVSDDLMVGLVRERLERPDAAAGFVLDGFPRTVPQAEALGTWRRARAADGGRDQVPEDELVRRLGARRVSRVRAERDAGSGGRRPLRALRRAGAARRRRAEVVRNVAVFARDTRPLVDTTGPFAPRRSRRRGDARRGVRAPRAA
jgi:adenylate kinase family enzyme